MAISTQHLRYYIPAFIWALFILFATIANVSTLESLRLQDLFAFDKPIHATLFGIQAGLLIYAQKSTGILTKRSLAVICLATAGFGVLTECLQGILTVSRFFDYFDMLADLLGCVIVYLWFIGKLR